MVTRSRTGLKRRKKRKDFSRRSGFKSPKELRSDLRTGAIIPDSRVPRRPEGWGSACHHGVQSGEPLLLERARVPFDGLFKCRFEAETWDPPQDFSRLVGHHVLLADLT